MKSLILALILIATQSQASFQKSVLENILDRVKSSKARGQQPIVVFDLDDTLFDSRSRKLIIQQEFANLSDIQKKYPKEATILANVNLEGIRYSVTETMSDLGITNEEFIQDFIQYWLTKFFTNEYVLLDKTIPGAAVFVNKVKLAGAKIIYLTGRDKPRIESGTSESLQKNHFPLSYNEMLFMKPDKDMNDTFFKTQVFSQINALGEVIAAFENEPRNINAMKIGFPGSQMVFLDTLHSSFPDVPDSDIPQIKNYLDQKTNQLISEQQLIQCQNNVVFPLLKLQIQRDIGQVERIIIDEIHILLNQPREQNFSIWVTGSGEPNFQQSNHYIIRTFFNGRNSCILKSISLVEEK